MYACLTHGQWRERAVIGEQKMPTPGSRSTAHPGLPKTPLRGLVPALPHEAVEADMLFSTSAPMRQSLCASSLPIRPHGAAALVEAGQAGSGVRQFVGECEFQFGVQGANFCHFHGKFGRCRHAAGQRL